MRSPARAAGGPAAEERRGPSAARPAWLMATAPDYLDPQLAYSTEAAEADWIAYTPLLTYRHRSGADGAELIPGLARRLPRVSPDGSTLPADAAKGPRLLERQTGQGERLQVHGRTRGPAQLGRQEVHHRQRRRRWSYDTGQAKRISGIVTDDSTGKINIKLGASVQRVLQRARPPGDGVGPQRHADARSQPPSSTWRRGLQNHGRRAGPALGHGEELPVRAARHPRHPHREPGPDHHQGRAGHSVSRRQGAAGPRRQLRPRDPTASRHPVACALGGKRLRAGPDSVDALLLHELRRATVQQRAGTKSRGHRAGQAGAGEIGQGIGAHRLLPDSPRGSSGTRRTHVLTATPTTLAIFECAPARQGVGHPATPVLVWVEDNSPQRAYARYYTKLLNRLGFNAHLRVVATPQDFGTIGKTSTDPQTGFASWFNDFPNPADFYYVLDAHSIRPSQQPECGPGPGPVHSAATREAQPGPAAGPGLGIE